MTQPHQYREVHIIHKRGRCNWNEIKQNDKFTINFSFFCARTSPITLNALINSHQVRCLTSFSYQKCNPNSARRKRLSADYLEKLVNWNNEVALQATI